LAYTFYVRNNGKDTLDCDASLVINGTAKGMDEAVRVMVYKNGEETIYAKPKYGTQDTPEENTTPFKDDSTIMTDNITDLKPNDVEKYTIVVWVEGNDPECIDDIMGGMMRMTMKFELVEDSEADQA
jgi:hypothetical protein